MHVNHLMEIAQLKRGQGWLGAMELVDYIDTKMPAAEAIVIKLNIQQEMGRLILSGTFGCDEAALREACNECIEAVIKNIASATTK